jgi:hypothetical protein
MAYVNLQLDAEEIFGPKEKEVKETEEETV